MKMLTRPVAIVGLSLSLIFLLGIAAEARSRYRYRPGKVGRFMGRTTTTGTRGFCEDSESPLALTAIAPLSHVGKTTTSQPTFVWFVPDQKSHSMEFVIYEQNPTASEQNPKSSDRTKIANSFQKFTGQPNQQGLIAFSLPSGVKLSPQKVYIWQVRLICNDQGNDKTEIAEAPIEIVSPAPRSQAGQSETDAWYDLMQQAMKSPQLSEPTDLIQDLLEFETTAQNSEQNTPKQKERIQEQRERLQGALMNLKPVAYQNKP